MSVHHPRCPCSTCTDARGALWWLPTKAKTVIVTKADEAFPFEEIERRRIEAFSREVRVRLEGFIRAGTRSLGKVGTMTKADLDRVMSDLSKLDAKLQSALTAAATPYATLVAEAGALAGLAILPDGTLSIEAIRDRVSPQVEAAAGRTASRMARSVGRSVAERIASTIREGITENLTGRDVADLIQSQGGGGFDASRAETIARTESARAFGEGELEAWKASGVVRGKTWLLAPYSCAFCEAAAARFGERSIPLDQPFYAQGATLRAGGRVMVLDYDATNGPPLHPNCRCTMQPELEEPD